MLISLFVVTGCTSGGSSSNAQKSVHAEAGSGSGTTLPANTLNPCELVDVQAADVFFAQQTMAQHADPRTCIRRAGDATLIVSLWRNEDRSFFEQYKKVRKDAQTVKNVGEVANFSTSLNSVQFIKSGNMVTVEVHAPEMKGDIKPVSRRAGALCRQEGDVMDPTSFDETHSRHRA